MSIDLESPEAKAAIKAAVEEATAALAAKNKELLGELKEARKGKTINPEDVEKLESRIEELTGQLTEAQKTAKKATTEAETAKKALADAEGFTQRLLVDNGLTDALTKAGVSNPVHLKAAKALLAGQIEVVNEGDGKAVKFNGKPLSDGVGEWAKGDEGKFFVAAPNNSGGGANGGSGGSGTKPTDLKTIDPGDRAARIAALQSRLSESGLN